MSQTIAICACDPGEALSFRGVFILVSICFSHNSSLPLPYKCDPCSQPVLEATAASDTQCLAQGGVGPADRVYSGKSDTIIAELFRNERSQENGLQGASMRNRELCCLLPLTQFVF